MIIIVLAIVTCFLNAYFLLFGFIIYCIGAVLVIISAKKIKVKALSVVLPVAFLLIGYNLADFFRPRRMPTTYIIPQNFTGKFRVVYGVACGIVPAFEKDRTIFNIPSDGILMVNSKNTSGIINEEFYFVNENKARTKIVIGESFDAQAKEKQFALMLNSGIFSKDSLTNIYYEEYQIFNNDTIKWTVEEQEKHRSDLDSIFEKKVDDCLNRSK